MRETSAAVRELIASARRAGVTLRFSADEAEKHSLTAGEGIEIGGLEGADLCVVLGGDGTILTALREYAGTGTPVFAVNYGEVGFLATVDPDGLGSEFDRAFAGDFETLRLPDDHRRPPRRPVDRDQRHLRAPQAGPARGRPGLRPGGRGDRAGALRRAGGLHAGRLHGLQPRQRRPDPGLGRARLRRVVHRAALADRAGAGRRPRGPADDQQRVARGARRGARRTGGPPASSGRARTSTWSSGGSTGCWRSCRGRASTTGCASGSGGWRGRAGACSAAALGQAPRASPGRAGRGQRHWLGWGRGERCRLGGRVASESRYARARCHSASRGSLPAEPSSVHARRSSRAATTLRSLRAEPPRTARLRRDPVVDLPMCWKSSVSRTCC